MTKDDDDPIVFFVFLNADLDAYAFLKKRKAAALFGDSSINKTEHRNESIVSLHIFYHEAF